jgi:adenylosuccinate lyase
VGARIAESALYGHLWGTDELRDVFGEEARIRDWVWILVQLAEAQGELGIIPPRAAAAIARSAKPDRLDLARIARATRETGHSTLGLIEGLQQVLPAEAAEWVYYGATVQDLTDTWMATAMRRVGAAVWRELRAIEALLLGLAERHRDTPMAGRTHGQPGAPVTFGLKMAGFADEVRRHLERMQQGAPRWLVGQLGGAVGALGFYGEQALPLRRRFCERVGLGDPGISWLTSRDRVAEFAVVLTLVCSTLGRFGNEVLELQRPEIGELAEPAMPGGVGSITMPHKRNPELSEHLVTLSRLVRANASVLLEGLVAEHERDGRGWKAEWVAFPEVCLLTGVALDMGRRVLDGLEVDAEAMLRNIAEAHGMLASERLLASLAPAIGKHRAQSLLQEALADGRRRGLGLEEAVARSEDLRRHLSDAEPALLLAVDVGASGAMVDEVLERARWARAQEQATWP